jgi:hypothetical protein
LLKRLFQSNVYLGFIWQKLDDCTCMDLCLGHIFCSICLHCCFSARIMLFLLLLICSTVEDRYYDISRVTILLSIVLAIQDLSCFYMKLRINFYISVRNVTQLLMDISLNM